MLENEDKFGDDKETEIAEHEAKHDKEPTKDELVKAYEEDKKDKENEKAESWKKTKNTVIIEDDKYIKKI